MRFPETLKLEQRQKDAIEQWQAKLTKEYEFELPDDFEDCECSSDLTFSLYGTGLGDNIICHWKTFELDVSIDDDNNLVCDYKDDNQ